MPTISVEIAPRLLPAGERKWVTLAVPPDIAEEDLAIVRDCAKSLARLIGGSLVIVSTNTTVV